MNNLTGVVKWFNDSKGYGFVTVSLNNEPVDAFAHYSQIKNEGFKTLSEGQEVTVDLIQGPKGHECANIRRVLK